MANAAGGYERNGGAPRGGRSNRGGRGGRNGGRSTAGRSNPAGDRSSCYTCGRSGHWSHDCEHCTDSVLKVCYYCYKPDNVMADCPANTKKA